MRIYSGQLLGVSLLFVTLTSVALARNQSSSYQQSDLPWAKYLNYQSRGATSGSSGSSSDTGSMGSSSGGGSSSYQSKRADITKEFKEIGDTAQKAMTSATEKHQSEVQKMTQSFMSGLDKLKVSEEGNQKAVEAVAKAMPKDTGASALLAKGTDDIVKSLQELNKTQVEMIKAIGKQMTSSMLGTQATTSTKETVTDKVQSFDLDNRPRGTALGHAMAAGTQEAIKQIPMTTQMVNQLNQHRTSALPAVSGRGAIDTSVFKGIKGQTYRYPANIKLE